MRLLLLLLSITAYAEVPDPLDYTPPAAPANGLSLSECYRAALKRSETLAIQEQALVQASELEKQAVAALLPSISASATLLRQDLPASNTLHEQNTVKLTATQPLFHGFREFALLRQRKAITASQDASYRDAARLLFYDVADAYYGTIALLADVRNFEEQLAVYGRRLKDLESFRKVGRSRTAEAISQRASIAALEADLENTRGQLAVQREVLAFLTGLPTSTPLRDVEPHPRGQNPLDAYLNGLKDRPDLRASRFSLEASENAVSAARAFHWPTADLTGNYYLDRPAGSSLKGVKWDVSLVLTLPLFQGGAIQSSVRQAASVQEQASLQLSRSERLAEEEVRRLHGLVASNRSQLAKLNEAVNLSKENFQAQQKDYSHGLVTNLEVLQATSNWQVALRSRERSLYALQSNFVKLQAAAGLRSETKVESKAE